MAKGYSITLVVGPGFPGHAAIAVRSPIQILRSRPADQMSSATGMPAPIGTVPN